MSLRSELRRRIMAAALCLSCLAGAGGAGAAAPEACNSEQLVTRRIACYADAAAAATDPAVCEVAADPTVRFQCLSLYAERMLDAAACSRIDAGGSVDETRALRESCVAGVAIRGAEPTLCGGLTIPALRDSCYLLLVVETGADPELCERIEQEQLRTACRESPAEAR